MVYDFYIRETGNFLFFITADSAKAMILMAKGKSGKERALGKFPDSKSTLTALDSVF